MFDVCDFHQNNLKQSHIFDIYIELAEVLTNLSLGYIMISE